MRYKLDKNKHFRKLTIALENNPAMSLDDYIRGLLNLPPSTGRSGHGGRGQHPRADEGGAGVGAGEENDTRVRSANALEGCYDFDLFMKKQMQSMFAPFFDDDRGGRGGWDNEGRGWERVSSDDQGETENVTCPPNRFSLNSILTRSHNDVSELDILGYLGQFERLFCPRRN